MLDIVKTKRFLPFILFICLIVLTIFVRTSAQGGWVDEYGNTNHYDPSEDYDPPEDYNQTINDNNEGTGDDNNEGTSDDSGAGVPHFLLSGEASNLDELGSVMTRGDFNADGREDVVIGVPIANINNVSYVGEVYVIFGANNNMGLGDTIVIDPHSGELDGELEFIHVELGLKGPCFGISVAVGDFDDNGYDDLAIGAANHDWQSKGQVAIIYSEPGAPLDFDNASNVWVFDESDLGGISEQGDLFGSSLACGDFDGDGYDDLAIGIPYEDCGGVQDAGAVYIVYGSSSGLRSTDSIFLAQGMRSIPGTSETDDRFGYSLATGDFDCDGYDDLAVSAPYEDHSSKTNCGSVWLFFGTSGGFRNFPGNTYILDQDDLNTDDDGVAHNEKFGWSMATGYLNADNYADLVIGVPFEDTGGKNSAGEVDIFYGGEDGYYTMLVNNQVLDQDTGDAGSVVEEDERFGHSVCVGDVNGDGYDDVAIGVPYESYGDAGRTGAAHVFLGNVDCVLPNVFLPRELLVPGGSPEPTDRWGDMVMLADTNGDGLSDFFVGMPGKDLPYYNMGAIYRIPADCSRIRYFDYENSVLIRKRL